MAKTKGAQNHKWTMDERKILEKLIQEGYEISYIASVLGVTRSNVYVELKKGVKEEEADMKRFIKYTAKNSIAYQLEKYKKKLEDGK